MRGGLSKDPEKRARQLANLRIPARVERPVRKNCSHCGRWKLAMEFSPRGKGNRLASQCRTCQRLQARERGGHRPRHYDRCLRGHKLSGDNLYVHADGGRRCKACWRITHAAWAKRNRDRINEYERIYHAAKRREAGIPARDISNRETPRRGQVSKGGERLRVPVGPFIAWLEENDHDLDSTRASHLHRQGTVHIDTVDAVLTDAGVPWLLNEFYPIEEAVAA